MTLQSNRVLPFQTDFPASEFVARRKNLAALMGRRGCALVQGAGHPPGFDPVRQSNEFYWLTGTEVPHSYLLFDAAKNVATLYLPPYDEKFERYDGPIPCASDGEFLKQRGGIDAVKPLLALADDLKSIKDFWLTTAGAEGMRVCRDTLRTMEKGIDGDPMNRRPGAEAHLRAKVLEVSPGAAMSDLTPLLDQLKCVKSEAELALMRRAGKLTALATTEAMRCTKPGVMEYQLGAIADYIFLANGTRGGAYRPIIAGGKNIWLIHYFRNNCALRDGDLAIFDYAPDNNYYTSDIGRMFPVNGTYSPAQRELYGLVVEYHKVLLKTIRPGVTPEQVMKEAADAMRPVVESWNWSKPAYLNAARNLLDFKGHLSHTVGMAVHDSGKYLGRPLEPGTVFAVDPQLWVTEEHLYIRVEDTVAVTETGIENLTADAPLELDDVERVMKEVGIFQKCPVVM